MLDVFPFRTNEPELVGAVVKFVGGSTAITKVRGPGITVTYISTGVVDVTWGESQGSYVGLFGHGFEATVQSGVKGYTVAAGVPSGNTVRLNITSAGDALVDLAALQWLSLLFFFKRVT